MISPPCTPRESKRITGFLKNRSRLKPSQTSTSLLPKRLSAKLTDASCRLPNTRRSVWAAAHRDGWDSTTAAVVVGFYAAVSTYRFGLDPDNHGIPIVTSSLDLFGSLSLILAIVILGLTATPH